MMYIFIWYTFSIVDIDDFFNKLGDTLYCLTSRKSIMHYMSAIRDYIHSPTVRASAGLPILVSELIRLGQPVDTKMHSVKCCPNESGGALNGMIYFQTA
jgi:hypothetical protein